MVTGAAAGAAMLVLGAPARPRAAATMPEAATLLVPGPEDGAVARIAARAAITLARGLVQAVALRVTVLGGPDGITAANRFAASAPLDGFALLVLPGQATHAHLLGDGRARFEPRRWPAICGSLQPAVLAGRGALADAAPLRVALPGPASPEAAALLALDLLGRRWVPVFTPTPDGAVAQGAADALVLSGAIAAARAGAQGLKNWFAFDAGTTTREAALREVPLLAELLPDPPRLEALDALRAASAALRARALVVLPPLTPADAVALWRGAAQRWADEEPDPLEAGTRRVTGAEATAAMAALCPTPEVALAYREWLMRRLNHRAG
jgi:hypothetical protein